MSASLVGSEMCIRDRPVHLNYARGLRLHRGLNNGVLDKRQIAAQQAITNHPGNKYCRICLLYTSPSPRD
eukprot:15161709-Alexandrium_andersonii.AAC.1